MNQEPNNLNTNNFSTQGNDEIPNNQPLNNQSFNQQPINSQPQPTQSFHQPIMQEHTPQSVNKFESGNANNTVFNNKLPKKTNLGLIIGIVAVVVVVLGVGIVFGSKLLSNNGRSNNINNNSSSNTTENNEDINNSTMPENIRENGKLPQNKSDLTAEESKYYKTEMVNAVINLNIDKLRVLLDEESFSVFEKISKNHDYANMYKKTIGTFIYLEESEAFVTKNMEYVYSKWYTDMWKNKSNIPDKVTDMTNQEVEDVYNKYYTNAPYSSNKLGGYSISIVNGYIKYNVLKIFEYVHVYYLPDLSPEISYENSYARYVFGDLGENHNLGYNYIDKMSIWRAVYDFDIDSIIKQIDINKDYKLSSTSQSYLEKYFKNSENRKLIEKYVNDNCEIYRDLTHVYIFAPAYIDEVKSIYQTYPYSSYTETELNRIKNLNLGQALMIFEGSETGWIYDITKIMMSLNILK